MVAAVSRSRYRGRSELKKWTYRAAWLLTYPRGLLKPERDGAVGRGRDAGFMASCRRGTVASGTRAGAQRPGGNAGAASAEARLLRDSIHVDIQMAYATGR